jgi:pimeloyl-ACP methyl ester carboxylesterase
MSQQEFTLRCNDAEIFCREIGEGPTLVLLHGFFATGARWDAYIPILANQYHLLIPDLRGHGRSTNPSNCFTHRQSALDIYALLDQCKVNTFLAAGYSSGGMTLLHMATQQPERVKAMALFGAPSYIPEQARVISRSVTMPDASNPALEYFRTIHIHGDDQIRALHEQFQGFSANYDDLNFTPPYLSTITARTLIVHGDRDELFPVAIPVEMYAAIPNASLWIVPNAGHDQYLLWPVPSADAPDRPDPVIEFFKKALVD